MNLQTPFMTYKIDYFANEVETTSYPETTYTITGLMKGTQYSVRVALNNSAGDGEYSSPAIGRTDVDRECLNVVMAFGWLLVPFFS